MMIKWIKMPAKFYVASENAVAAQSTMSDSVLYSPELDAYCVNISRFGRFITKQLFPDIEIEDRTLSYGGFFNGYPYWGSMGGRSIVYWPFAGVYIYHNDDLAYGDRYPVRYMLSNSNIEDGDEYYKTEKNLFNNCRLGWSGTGTGTTGSGIEFDFVGAEAGKTAKGRFVWPRLEQTSGSGRAGLYNTPQDGGIGRTNIIVGDAEFRDHRGGTVYLSLDGTKCGLASKINGTWTIGLPNGSDIWYTTDTELSTLENEADTITWTPHTPADYEGVQPATLSWNYQGRKAASAGYMSEIYVTDYVRYL